MSHLACSEALLWPPFGVSIWYHVRAQNGPGIAVVEHRPGPDLSASLDMTEEH